MSCSSVRSPSRTGRRNHRLQASASALALGAAVLAPQAASAAGFTAATEAELKAAITNANASADASSTITLTADIAITDPAAIPAASKAIVFDNAGFDLTGAGLNTFTVTLQGGGDFQFTRASTFGGALSINGSNLRVESGGTLTAGQMDSSGSSTVTVRNPGSVLTTSRLNFASDAGTSTIQIEDGGVLRQVGGTSGAMARTPGSVVTINVTNPGSRLESDTPLTFSTGVVNVTVSDGGTLEVKSRLLLGAPSGASQHALTVTGPASDLIVRNDLSQFRGTLDVLAGAEASAGSITMGGSAGQAQTLTIAGGSTFDVTGAVQVGMTSGGVNTTSKLILNTGGAMTAGGAVTVGGASTRTGELIIGGSGAVTGAGALTAAGLTLTAGTGALTFNHNDANYTFAPAIGGGGAINHTAGATHLTGDSSAFAGATHIGGGTLYVDNRLGGGASTVAVNSGGTLGGVGTIGGNVTVAGGRIAPGDSPGTLTIVGNLALDSASVLEVEFGQSGVVGGPLNDLVKVGGNLTLDGAVNVTETAGGTFGVGLYRIFSYGGTLTDQTLTVGTTPAGVTASVQTAIAGQVNLINTGGLPVNFWDGDGAGSGGNNRVNGGAGTWTAAAANWTTTTGAVNNTYTPGDFVVFAGASGAVTVDAVTVGGAQFAVDGYRLAGGAITLSGGGRTFRVGDGTADGRNYVAIIDSRLVGAGAGAGLTKTDLGTLILNGDYGYTGVTTVSAGTLLVNGIYTGGGANGLVVSANGTIGGTGVIRGGVITGTLAPGGLTNAGTLTTALGLVFNASATLRYRLGQAGVVGGALNDLLVVNGNLTLNGTLNVVQSPGGTFGAGIYRLIDYTGTLTDNVLDIGSLPTGYTGVIQTSIAKQVNLLVAGGPPPGGGGGGAPPTPQPFTFWDPTGAGGDGAIRGGEGIWRAAGDANWTNAGAAANGAFANGQFAIFAGQAGAVTIDNSQGAVRVSGLQFAADGYRLGGQALTLAGETATLRVGDGTTAGAAFTATVDAEITGAARLVKSDGGTLILTGRNTYAGGTTIEGGTLVGSAASFGQGAILDQAALVIDQPSDATMANAIDGAGGFWKTGAGRLTYAGQGALSGATTVAEGVLELNGSLAGSAITVRGGAALTGSGTAGAVSVDAGGVLAPAVGLGTLTVNGALAQAAGSVLRVELDPASGTSDRLVLTGAATLAAGAILDVARVGAGAYRLGTVYTVLSAAGGVRGTYGLTGDIGPISAFLGLRDSYDANNVYLTVAQVRPLADAGTTPNQVQTATGVDSLPIDNPVRATLVGLPTDAAAQVAFDQLSGEANASARAVLIAQSGALRDAAFARLQGADCDAARSGGGASGCPDDDRAAGWAQALGAWGDVDGGGKLAGVDHDMAGFLTGVDLPLDAWRVGGLVGYSRSTWNVGARGASGKGDSYHLGAYAGRSLGRLNLRLGAGYAWHDIRARRGISVPGLAGRLEADYDAATLQAFGEVGYRIGGRVGWEPFAGVAHVRLRTDAFTETGGQAVLSARRATMESTVTTVGIRPAVVVEVGAVRATLRGMAGWRHAFGDVAPTTVQAFVAGGQAFTVQGSPLDRDAAAFEAAADVLLGARGIATLSYGGQFGGHASEQRVRLDLRLRF